MPTPLTPDELDHLLDAPLAQTAKPLIQARDAALLGVLASTGWRVARVAALDRGAIADPGLPLTNHAKHWCQVYLGRRRDNARPLFLRHDRAGGQSGLALTTRSAERIVAHYATVAGIVGTVTPERIRATVRQSER